MSVEVKEDLGNMRQTPSRNKPGGFNFKLGGSFVYSIGSVSLGLLVGALVIRLSGFSPIEAYQALFKGALGDLNAVTEMLVKTVTLLLTSLGITVAFKARIFNLGAEGQILMGVIGASIVGLFFSSSNIVIDVSLALLLGGVLGGLWSGLAGWMIVRFKANEIIITLMMNYLVLSLITYLVNGPWRDPSSTQPFSARFVKTTDLPILLPGTRLNIGIIIALIAAVSLWFVLNKTVFGYKIIVTGKSMEASHYAGIDSKLLTIVIMIISGALSGLAGAVEVTGVHHRLLEGISSGYGFTAIAIALLGQLNPVGIIFASMALAILFTGADGMQRYAGLPSATVTMLQGMILVFIIMGEWLKTRGQHVRKTRIE